jgi:hypothetical protein
MMANLSPARADPATGYAVPGPVRILSKSATTVRLAGSGVGVGEAVSVGVAVGDGLTVMVAVGVAVCVGGTVAVGGVGIIVADSTGASPVAGFCATTGMGFGLAGCCGT